MKLSSDVSVYMINKLSKQLMVHLKLKVCHSQIRE